MASTTPNKTAVALGILSIAIGAIPLLAAMGILPRGNAPADSAPPWMSWAIGALFAGAGIIVVMRGVFNVSGNSSASPASAPRLLRLANDAIAIAIAGGMAALFSWVAFGPGVRHFSISIGGLSIAAPGSGDAIGRVAFGLGAIFFWCIAAAFAVVTLRSWRQ